MQIEDGTLDIGNETERLEEYCEGGFCPIHLGDCIAGRFTILRKLGHGGFGTVWLVRDAANRHGRYVALKVVLAAYSEDYEPAAVLNRLKKYERDHGSPGVFLVELERLFHTSRNGRHLCQVFPILGPPLSQLNTPGDRLYPTFAGIFARGLASGLATLHSLGVCHGDLTMRNVAIKLGRSLDHLTEQQLGDLLGPSRTISVDHYFPEKPPPGPQYLVGASELTQLPVAYLSTRICILDFDQAFTVDNAPRKVPYIPAHYLAPESIFALTNGPAADVWAMGCILFNLKYPIQPFWDYFESHPFVTAKVMCHTLGSLPEEWMVFPFLNGWPVHKPLESNLPYVTVKMELVDKSHLKCSLEEQVDDWYEPRRRASGENSATALENFCLHYPNLNYDDIAGQEKFEAENTTPIQKEEAKLFADLLRKMFEYDHTKRITARHALEHPWMQGIGQTPSASRTLMAGAQNASHGLRTNLNHPNKTSQTPQQAAQKTSKSSAQHPLPKMQTTAPTGMAHKKKTGP